MNKFNFNKLTPFKWFVLENFPFIEADFDALTEWQLFCKLGKEMNKIINSENTLGTQMENVTNAFIELQNYVNNYFENLDVQEEINNKLNEMAQDGTLQEIIAEYLNTKSLLGFDNVSDMINSENLIEGSYAKTLGFHNLNDGGSKIYKIIKEQSATNVNGRTKINLGHDDLYAISLDDIINVKEYGAKGDGITDDTEAIQFCIDTFPHRTIYFPAGNYLISQPLNIKVGNEYTVDLFLENSARIFTNTEIEELLSIGKVAAGNWSRSQLYNMVTIQGGTFDATNTQYAIYITADRKQTRILNTNIINVSNIGIYIDRNVVTSTSISSDTLIDTISITGTGNFENSIGIYLKGTDNELNEIRISGIKTCMIIEGGGNLISNGHLTAGYTNTTVDMINNSTGVIIKGFGNNYFTNFYVDTYGKSFIFESDNMRTYFDNLQVFFWKYDETTIATVFELHARSYIRCTNSYFEMPIQGTRQVVKLTTNVEYDTRKYPVLKGILKFINCDAININVDRDLFKEMQLNNNYRNNYTPNSNPWSVNMQQNQYYPLMLLSGGRHEFIVQMANDQISKVTVNVSSSNPSITCEDLQHTSGGHYQQYFLALANGFTDETGNYFAYLLIKATDIDSSFNPSINDFKNYWIEQRFAIGSTTPVTTPTIITESNMLP